MSEYIVSVSSMYLGYITLMIGLIIGVIRMVMDFSYPEPLCMEHDTRPSIVANVSLLLCHYITGKSLFKES